VRGIPQAKNGGELFWEEKFHAANEKAQARTQGALHFFLLSGEGAGFGGGFFKVFPGSHHVPFWFSISSHQVFNMFPKFSMYSPTCSP